MMDYVNKAHRAISVKKNIKTIVLIQNYGCSGSVFFQSLLDGHSNLLSLPALHAHQLTNFYRNYRYLEQEEFISKFLEDHYYWFDPTSNYIELMGLNTMCDSMDSHVCVDKDVFFEVLNIVLEMGDLRDFIISVYLVYNILMNEPLEKKTHLIFPIHSLPNSEVQDLQKAFPIVKAIYTIRDPFKNIKSMIKHLIKESPYTYRSLLAGALGQALGDFIVYYKSGLLRPYNTHGLIPYPSLKEYKIHYVSLEALHSAPKKTLQEAISYLNIKFEDNLLISTFSNKRWNNRKNSIKINGFSEKINKQDYEFKFSKFDEWRLKKLIQYTFTQPQKAHPLNMLLKKAALLLLLFWPFFDLFRLNLKVGWKNLSKKREKVPLMNRFFSEIIWKIIFISGIYVEVPLVTFLIILRQCRRRNKYKINPIVN